MQSSSKCHTIVRPIVTAGLALLVAFFFNTQFANAQDGKKLFMTNCATCHNPIHDATGPALKGVSEDVPSRQWIYNWVHNSSKVLASGDKYANDLYEKWNETAMTHFPNLTEDDIDAIIKYVNNYEPPKSAATASTGKGGGSTSQSTNIWLYIGLTLLLLVAAIILGRVNKTLKRVSNKQEGIPNKKAVPLFRNKIFITIASLLLMVLAGYWIVNGAVETGNQQNYMPKQPIFFSHRVHAGVNQINCLYCHSGALKSRQALIPSTNVCMNCHKQISEYTGSEKLFTYEGKRVNGTEEIHKLYKYAGWNPKKKRYNKDKDGNIIAKPVHWVKIHNLPDFVYFNHSQHVVVGKIQCQTCHGPIPKMDEVYQYAALNMGWCINCHRTTDVQFTENNYFSIYTKYQKEIKEGKRKGVTEKEMGGTECGRCHY